MKKRLLLGLSIAAAALAGCSQNELLENNHSPQNNKDRSIAFGSYVSRPTSRATGVSLADFQANGRFKAWAYVTTTDKGLSANIADAASISLHTALSGGKALDGTDQFKYDNTTDPAKPIWASTLGQKYYWPDDGLGKMSFYALSNRTGYPSAAVTTLTDPTNASGAKFAYTIGTNGTKADEDKQEDLMAAQMYDKEWSTDVETSKIALDFKHLLTQVRFSAKASDASYRVKILSLKVSGATNQGEFNFDLSAARIGSWVIPAGATKADYTYFDATVGGAQQTDFATGFPKDDATDPTKHFIGSTVVDFPLFGAYTTGATPAPDKTQALILLPSVGKDASNNDTGLKGVTITIAYQCYILSGNAGEDGTAVAHWVKDGTVLNRTIELTEKEMWGMNKKVCYVLTLFNSTSGKIIYTPVVSDWTDQNSDSNLHPDTDVPPVVIP